MPKQEIHPHWWVYIVECRDSTYYTGITPNIEQRIKTHNAGKGAAYTRGRGPVSLVHSEKFDNHRAAAQRECEIKKLKREEKENLIRKII